MSAEGASVALLAVAILGCLLLIISRLNKLLAAIETHRQAVINESNELQQSSAGLHRQLAGIHSFFLRPQE